MPWGNVGGALPPLGENEIHIWSAVVDRGDAELARLQNLLSAAERERAARLRIPQHRRRHTAARGLLRELLGGYCGVPPRAVRFGFGARGKPFSSDAPEIFFNASDSREHALFAFCKNRELGVDLEALPRTVNHLRLARKIFTAGEHRAFLQLPPARQPETFLTCWTRKEAYGKARGCGIYYAMNRVALCGSGGGEKTTVADHQRPARRWTLLPLRLKAGVTATLVVAAAADEALRLGYYDWPAPAAGR